MPDNTALSWADLDKLRILLQRIPPFTTGGGAERTAFLKQAGLPAAWIAQFNCEGPAEDVITQLLNTAQQSENAPPDLKPGYTMLGLILNQILADEYVGLSDGLYIATLIQHY